MKRILLLLNILIAFQAFGKKPEPGCPIHEGIDINRLQYADTIIMESIRKKEIPGAVLAVVHHGQTAYLKAYGNKQVYPDTIPMDVNTVFDLASLSKPVATATSAMILIEKGKMRLHDKVSLYIPGFKDNIQIIHLLTHTSGLPPYAPADTIKKRQEKDPDALIHYIADSRQSFDPGTGFQYSCLNFITLQRIIENISGKNLRDFAKENIFDVLGMEHTDYCPTGETLARTAPTERQSGNQVLRGTVHDPLARLNHGISGNAGLFSDAKDLSLFAAALLHQGAINGKRILSPLGVKSMATIPEGFASFGRSLGWDISSDYSSNQGDLFGPETYGHTGYTGTSLIIDPQNDIAVILLTNRVHPDDKGSVVRLRALVANAVAAAVRK